MQFSSPLIASVQSVLAAGNELQIPELLLPVTQLSFPVQANPQNVLLDMRGRFASVTTAGAINQGAGTGPQATGPVILDRGLYRFCGYVASMTFVGPAASSAAALAAFAALTDPLGAVNSRIAGTGLAPLATWIQDRFDLTLQFSQPGWSIVFGTFVASAAGQSMAVEYSVQVARLL